MSRSASEIKEYQKKWYQENKERIRVKYYESQKDYRRTVEGFIHIRLSKTKHRSIKANIEYNLIFKYMLDLWNRQEGLCALTGIPMTIKVGEGRKHTAASIDKIEPEKGYVMGNVRFICQAVNMMRQDFTDQELRDWCKLILKGNM